MAFLVGEAFDYNDFVKQIRGFVQGHPQLVKSDPKQINSGVTRTGTGDGVLYITTEAHTPKVSYKLVCTVAGSDVTSPKAQFNVYREDTSPRTLLGTLVSSERFQHGDPGASPRLTGLGLILRTTTAWAVNDTISFTLGTHNLSTLESPNSFGNWVEDRFTEAAPDSSGDFVTEWIAHAPTVANAGQSPETPMHFGMQTAFSEADSYYNVRVAGMDAFNNSSLFTGQVNYSGSRYILTSKNAFRFWLTADSDALVVCAKVSSVYQWGYLGLIELYATGGQHAKPMFVGGMSETVSTLPSSSNNAVNSAFWNPANGSRSLFRWVDGSWYNFQNRDNSYTVSEADTSSTTNGRFVWPFRDQNTAAYQTSQAPRDARSFVINLQRRFDDTYELLPVMLVSSQPQIATIGEFKFIKQITGHLLSSEDTGTDTSVSPNKDFIVLQNANLTAREQYVALELE